MVYYVEIPDVDDNILAFLGYTLVAQDENFKCYRDLHGDDHVVDKALPRLGVDDQNDAMILGRITGKQVIIQVPPKKTN